MILARYILEIVTEEDELDDDMAWKRVLADLPARLEELEENLTDMLPNGYKAQIGEK